MYKHFLALEIHDALEPFQGFSVYLTLLWIVQIRLNLLWDDSIVKAEVGLRVGPWEMGVNCSFITSWR